MNRLTGKCALITGGASGIGLATARRFLEEGAQVVITDIDSERGERASMELARQAQFLTHDVTSETSWEQAVATTTQTLGGFNVLVNCAGILTTVNIEETSFELWRRTLGINLDGTFLGCRAAVREMRERGGRCASVAGASSISARFPGLSAIPIHRLTMRAKGGSGCLRNQWPFTAHASDMGFAVTRSIRPALTPRWPRPILPLRVTQRQRSRRGSIPCLSGGWRTRMRSLA